MTQRQIWFGLTVLLLGVSIGFWWGSSSQPEVQPLNILPVQQKPQPKQSASPDQPLKPSASASQPQPQMSPPPNLLALDPVEVHVPVQSHSIQPQGTPSGVAEPNPAPPQTEEKIKPSAHSKAMSSELTVAFNLLQTGLVDALWNYDIEYYKQLIEWTLEEEGIAAVAIYDSPGSVVFGLQRQPNGDLAPIDDVEAQYVGHDVIQQSINYNGETIGMVKVYLDKSQDSQFQTADQRLNFVMESLSVYVSLPLWNMNIDTMEKLMRKILNNYSIVQAAAIFDAEEIMIFACKTDADGSFQIIEDWNELPRDTIKASRNILRQQNIIGSLVLYVRPD